MPAKFKRCVEKAKAKGGGYNPYAVCTAVNAGDIKAYRKREAKARKKK